MGSSGMAEMSTLLHCPSSISSADHGVAHLQRARTDGFGENHFNYGALDTRWGCIRTSVVTVVAD